MTKAAVTNAVLAVPALSLLAQLPVNPVDMLDGTQDRADFISVLIIVSLLIVWMVKAYFIDRPERAERLQMEREKHAADIARQQMEAETQRDLSETMRSMETLCAQMAGSLGQNHQVIQAWVNEKKNYSTVGTNRALLTVFDVCEKATQVFSKSLEDPDPEDVRRIGDIQKICIEGKAHLRRD